MSLHDACKPIKKMGREVFVGIEKARNRPGEDDARTRKMERKGIKERERIDDIEIVIEV